MLALILSTLLIVSLLAVTTVLGFVVYLLVKYTPIILRIFEEKPLFLPLRLALTGEDHGPDLKVLLPLIGRERAALRLGAGAEG